MRKQIALVLAIGTTLCLHPAHAGNDPARELKKAQALLASGDYDQAYPLYRQFAERGNALAQFTVGMFSQFGWGGQASDPVAACGWFGQAAEGDIPAAAHYAGECLEDGVDGPADAAKAAHWYQRAADLGHYLSLCSLAELYMHGEGVPKNPQHGLELCQQAARTGSMPAQVQVGRYLLQGDPSIRDPQAAHAWFDAVAETSPQAQYYLGLIHRDGLGTQASLQEARYWFERAASTGYTPAYFPTAKLYFDSSPDYAAQRPSADDLAKTYLWLRATAQRSQHAEELAQTQRMLEQVRTIMPPSWAPTLDERVNSHLTTYAAVTH